MSDALNPDLLAVAAARHCKSGRGWPPASRQPARRQRKPTRQATRASLGAHSRYPPELTDGRSISISIHAHRYSTCCASGLASPGPRKAATTANAAPARCILMDAGSRPASRWQPRWMDARFLPSKGISDGETLHPMQQAFIDHDALQCGYCTPGQIMAGIACVREGHAQSREQIREYMSGNICRCGAYGGIVSAIQQAASQIRRG